MKRLLFILILVSMSLCFATGAQTRMDKEAVIARAFQETGALPEKYILHYGSRMSSVTHDKMDLLVAQFKQHFKLKTLSDQGVSLFAGRLSQDISMRVITKNEVVGKQSIPYLSLQIIGKGVPKPLFYQLVSQVTEIFRQHSIVPSYHFSIQGKFKYDSINKDRPIWHVLHRFSATPIEAMETSRLKSVSAYSPFLNESIETNGKRMNLQVAVRDNDKGTNTILTMGTPIITIEY